MTGIKEFFEELKIRISNPLISSFIISWLICNWKIVILLLFYRADDFPVEHSQTFMSYILANSSFVGSFFLPLTLALAYTFASPYVSAWVKLFHAQVSAKNVSDILESTDERSMPMKKFIKQMKDINEQEREIQDLAAVEGQIRIDMQNIEKENTVLQNKIINLKEEVEIERESGTTARRMLDSATEHAEILKTENNNLKVDLEDTKNHNSELQNALDNWNYFNDFAILNGRWHYELEVSNISSVFSSGDIITIRDGRVSSDDVFYCEITDLIGNYSRKNVSFIINSANRDFIEVTESYFLKMDTMSGKLSGIRNGNGKVSLTRLSDNKSA